MYDKVYTKNNLEKNYVCRSLFALSAQCVCVFKFLLQSHNKTRSFPQDQTLASHLVKLVSYLAKKMSPKSFQ